MELIRHNNELDNSLLKVDLSSRIADFLREQDVKDSSRDTYRRAITQFFSFMSNNNVLPEGTDILEYKQFLNKEGLSAYTINAYLVVVRKFFAWTERRADSRGSRSA